jgi:hypothetical protein
MPPKKVTQHGAANSAKTVTSSNVTNNPVRQPKQTAMKRKAPAAVTITTENKRRRKVPTRFVPGVDEQQVVFTDADANEEAELETNILGYIRIDPLLSDGQHTSRTTTWVKDGTNDTLTFKIVHIPTKGQ